VLPPLLGSLLFLPCDVKLLFMFLIHSATGSIHSAITEPTPPSHIDTGQCSARGVATGTALERKAEGLGLCLLVISSRLVIQILTRNHGPVCGGRAPFAPQYAEGTVAGAGIVALIL
jgi:hypothetical protein